MSEPNPTSRRDFATRTALAGAGLMLADAATVRGSQANSRLRVGIVGLGGRGSLIAGMLVAHPDYELVAACDYFPEVVAEKGEALGVPEAPLPAAR